MMYFIFKIVIWHCEQTYWKEKKGVTIDRVPMKDINSCSQDSPQLHHSSAFNTCKGVTGRTYWLYTMVNPPLQMQ